jgi:hypothetical protein
MRLAFDDHGEIDMKALLIATLMTASGTAYATDLPEEGDHQGFVSLQPDEMQGAVLSRKKRGVAPQVGMACSEGYKLVGEDCIMAGIEFE